MSEGVFARRVTRKSPFTLLTLDLAVLELLPFNGSGVKYLGVFVAVLLESIEFFEDLSPDSKCSTSKAEEVPEMEVKAVSLRQDIVGFLGSSGSLLMGFSEAERGEGGRVRRERGEEGGRKERVWVNASNNNIPIGRLEDIIVKTRVRGFWSEGMGGERS